MTTYIKTKNGEYEVSQLEAEINSDASIVPSCLAITATGTSLSLEFAADLSVDEETALDALILAHVPDVESIDVAQLPFSEIDGNKLAVHPSYKPNVSGITTYAVWGGAGDELDVDGNLVDNGMIGGGPLLHLDCGTDDNYVEAVAKFHPGNGRVWLHEAYIKFQDAPSNSYLSGGILAMGVPLQQVVNLDLVVTDDVITYAPGGPGTGTHGFADPNKISLVPRSFSKDGDWDLVDGNLIPAAGNGGYKLFAVDTLVHRFVNHIPTKGSSPYFSITSDETTELPKNYYVRVCAGTTDGSNFASVWHASVILELYRERTFNP